MGCYITPDEALNIEDVVAAIRKWPRGDEILMAGDFNANLAETEGTMRAEEITADLATAGQEYLIAHFLPGRNKYSRDKRTWSMLRGVQEVGSRTDYLLGMDFHVLQNLSVWDARQKLYHYLVLGYVRGAPGAEQLL